LTDLLFNSQVAPQWYLLLLGLHFLMGGLAAFTAQKKGLSLKRWIVFGMIGGTPSLVAAILAEPRGEEG
jgi:hypothetical protein